MNQTRAKCVGPPADISVEMFTPMPPARPWPRASTPTLPARRQASAHCQPSGRLARCRSSVAALHVTPSIRRTQPLAAHTTRHYTRWASNMIYYHYIHTANAGPRLASFLSSMFNWAASRIVIDIEFSHQRAIFITSMSVTVTGHWRLNSMRNTEK